MSSTNQNSFAGVGYPVRDQIGFRRRVSCVMRLPWGRFQGSVVAVGYSPCRTIWPRSSTSVFRPFSVSSLAAHPPLIPDPTTIASNEFVSMFNLIPPKPQRGIMDHLRVLLVPFQTTSLILIGVFALLFTLLAQAGIYGLIISVLVQGWVLKYCYVLVERLADGATEPPVMDSDMLSPTEVRPWIQLALVVMGVLACSSLSGNAQIVLAVTLLALLPATIAVLGIGEPFFQAVNPLMLFRLIRGLGPYYLLILASILVYAAFLTLLSRLHPWNLIWNAAILVCELSFFGLIGGCMYLRREQLGIEASRSPERTAAREEAERVKVRAKMIDDVFQQVRIGKHVEA